MPHERLDRLHDFGNRLVFTEQECIEILNQSKNLNFVKSENYSSIDKSSRISLEAKIPESMRFWTDVKQHVYSCISAVNEDLFRFSITGFEGRIRLLRYEAPDGRFGWHSDRGLGAPVRKLSFSIQLSPDSDYQGGNLEFHTGEIQQATRQVGQMIVFPSYILHRVTPITEGSRSAIVGWVTGPEFQ